MTLNGALVSPPSQLPAQGLAIFSEPLDAPTLAEGENHWIVTSRDGMGNETSVNVTQSRDSLPPRVTILSPETDSATNQGSVNLVFEISETGLGLAPNMVKVLRASALDGSLLYFSPSCSAVVVSSTGDESRVTCNAQVQLAEGVNSLRVSHKNGGQCCTLRIL